MLVSSSGLVRETATPTIPGTGVQLGADLFPWSWAGLTLFCGICFGHERICHVLSKFSSWDFFAFYYYFD